MGIFGTFLPYNVALMQLSLTGYYTYRRLKWSNDRLADRQPAHEPVLVNNVEKRTAVLQRQASAAPLISGRVRELACRTLLTLILRYDSVLDLIYFMLFSVCETVTRRKKETEQHVTPL